MVEEDDWRIAGQAEYLTGVRLHRRRFTREIRDHDHCEFCWAKFMEEDFPEHPEILHEGYTTDDNYRWICDTCFTDFRERFSWTLVEEGSN